jgi:hypothetical protein
MTEVLKYYIIISRFNKRHDICDKEPKKLEFPTKVMSLTCIHEIQKYIITNRFHMRPNICDNDKNIWNFPPSLCHLTFI